MTLSLLKFHIDNSLKFVGCVISDKGVFLDPDRVSALSDFPVPLDQTGVRSFLGLCNQLAFFIPDFQHHTVALRQLTGKRRSFIWLPEHQVEFDTLKKILSGNLVVRHFDSRKLDFMVWVMLWDILSMIVITNPSLKLCTVAPRVPSSFGGCFSEGHF